MQRSLVFDLDRIDDRSEVAVAAEESPRMPAMQKIRILIADDHAILRSGLKMLISAQTDMEVVSEAADGDRTIQAARDARPDVALLDLTMPGSGGMGALGEITRCC